MSSAARDVLDILEFRSSSVSEAGLIEGVKFLGPKSDNQNDDGTRNVYPLENRRAELGLYEGAPVYVDHPPRSEPGAERSVRDRIGTLRPRSADDSGSFGDLQINLGHPLAQQVLWAAANDPGQLALSHNAVGIGRVEGGETIVEVKRVRSVDLVPTGGTTRSLFESAKEPSVTIEALENLAEMSAAMIDVAGMDDGDEKRAAMLSLGQQIVSALGEAQEQGEDVEGDEKGEEGKGTGAEARRLIRSLNDKGLSDEQIGERVGDGGRSGSVISSIQSGEIANPPTSLIDALKALDAKTKPEEDMESRKTIDALQKRVDELELAEARRLRHDQVKSLIEGANLPGEAVSETFLEQLMGAPGDKLADLVEDRRAAWFHRAPTSRAPGAGKSHQSAYDHFKALTGKTTES